MTTLSAKARDALAIIAAHGDRARVTRQMIDRLSRDDLIDFDPRHGWHITLDGRAALALASIRDRAARGMTVCRTCGMEVGYDHTGAMNRHGNLDTGECPGNFTPTTNGATA